MSAAGVAAPHIPEGPLPIECPACEQTYTAATGWLIDAATAAHDARCPGAPRPDKRRTPVIAVECEHCGRHLGDASNSRGILSRQVRAMQALHACPTGLTPTRKYGDDGPPRKPKPPCSVDGCEKRSRAGGMCDAHYRAARRAKGRKS